jgi:hypothetical protein
VTRRVPPRPLAECRAGQDAQCSTVAESTVGVAMSTTLPVLNGDMMAVVGVVVEVETKLERHRPRGCVACYDLCAAAAARARHTLGPSRRRAVSVCVGVSFESSWVGEDRDPR